MEKAKDPIGQQLREVRKARKVSVPELEEILNIPKDRIYKWEKGFAPKYEDRLTIEKWINDTNWNKVPREKTLNVLQNSTDKETIIIDHNLFLQLIAEKEARRLDAEEKAKQARQDLNEVKEEKKELMTIIKENLTALLISSNAARQDLAKILLVNRVDDGKIMDNQDIAAGREVGSSAKEAGMLELTTEVAASLENRKQTEKGKRVKVRK